MGVARGPPASANTDRKVGRKKRLRAYTNKYWQAPTAAENDDDDVSSSDDNGVVFGNDNVETEGRYTPQERNTEAMSVLSAHSHSYLEDDDGTGS